MSKTAAEIGLIVGGITLALLAGPVGITLLGSLTVMNGMIGIGVTTTLSGVGLALRPTPKPVGTANTINFNAGPSPRRVIYGQFQTAGVLTYASFPPSMNQATTDECLHLVYTLTAHEITSFDAVAINGSIYNFGTDITFNNTDQYWHTDAFSGGVPPDFYAEHVYFEFDGGGAAILGQPQPFPNLAAADPAWNSDCTQKGCAKVHVMLRWDSGWTALFPSGQIPNIQFLVTGKKLIDPRIPTAWVNGSYAQYSWLVDNNGRFFYQQNAGTNATGSSRPNFEVAGLHSTVTDGACTWFCYNPYKDFFYEFGAPQLTNARLVCDNWIMLPGIAVATGLVIEAPSGYLQICTGAGTAGTTYPAFSLSQGGTTTDGSATWTCMGRSQRAINPSNSALCTNDYLLDTDAGMGAAAATIDTSSVIAAANVCEEQVVIIVNADSSVVKENLYACDGMFDHSSPRGNVLQSLCGSMAGWVIPPGDLWHVFAGAYITPTVSLGDKDMRAAIKGDFRLSKRDVANGMKGTYVPRYLPTNPAQALALTQIPAAWQQQSFPPYQANGLAGKPNYLNVEDGGQIIWQDMQLDFTTSLWMAQRLAKIALMRLRFQETVTLPCKLSALVLEAGDTFTFTHPRWGLSTVFEAAQCSLVFDGGGGSANDSVPAIGVDLVGRQVDPSIYTFTPPSSVSDYGEYSPFGVTGVMTGVE